MEGGSSGYGDPGPLALALQLPSLPLLVSLCLRNGREAQRLLDLASIASHFDSLFRSFVPLAHASHRLQHAWDQLWLAQDPTVVTAIPLIAHEMSRLNWARARLTHLMDCQLRLLQSRARSLRHFVEVNSTLAEELRLEGVERLAADKERLVDIERGIELRVRRFLEVGSLSRFTSNAECFCDFASQTNYPTHCGRSPNRARLAREEGRVWGYTPSVCSKRFLTTKVDRCVTGLVAQQQTVGPLQLPADVAALAQGLLDPKAMPRLSLGEALPNLVWAKATGLKDVKGSGNQMYAAKLDGEGAALYDATVALKETMIELEVAIDGRKDSLSMAAQAGDQTVKCPENLVISAYVVRISPISHSKLEAGAQGRSAAH